MSETTEQGYKIAKAIIAREGAFTYRGYELGYTGDKANKLYQVHRTAEELGKSDTLKSFEGKPLTITHPKDKKVTAEDWNKKAVGHIQNVRFENGLLICDAYINDGSAVNFLNDNKDVRELSVGYGDSDIQEINGKLYHVNIRGNHTAFVAEGRAGSKCRLLDSKGGLMGISKILKLLKGKKLNDADGVELTADELKELIASLETELKTVEANEGDEAKEADLKKQIAELKEQLASKTAVNDEETADTTGGDLKAENDKLKSENEQLRTENEQLKTELEQLKAEKNSSTALNDAKTYFPKIKLNDAKSARDVYIEVLLDSSAFSKDSLNAMTDGELRASYNAYKLVGTKKSNVGKFILNDGAPTGKSASYRLGGK